MKQSKPSFTLKLKARASLFTGKCTVHLSNKSENPQGVHDYDFYLGAWMGGKNKEMKYQMLSGQADGTGETSLSISIYDSDYDSLKLGVYIRDPDTKTMRHISSGFKCLNDLANSIDGVTDCGQAKDGLIIKDNYSRNQVLMHFANDGTDLKSMREVCSKLKPSILKSNNEINKKVLQMTFGLHNWIEKSACVSNSNGGPNFVNSMCFTEAMGCAINYPLLDMTYSSTRHRAPLAMLSYLAFSTLHYCGIPPEKLLAMEPQDFVSNFVVPLCTSFTVCPTSSVYSGDKTIDAKGNLDLGTEDFAMVLSKHFFTDICDSYLGTRCDKLSDKTDKELQDFISSCVSCPCANALGHGVIKDDCETLAGLIKSLEGSYHKYHLKAACMCSDQPKQMQVGLSAGAPGADPIDFKLGDLMWAETRDLKNLASIPKNDFVMLAKVLNRCGELRENNKKGKAPCSQIALSIVSAKGASFAMGNKDLNGHACTVSQTLDANGNSHFRIGEGTANMNTRNLPATCPKNVTLILSDGEKAFKTMEALGCVAQNLSEYVKTSGKARMAQCIPSDFGGEDAYKTCPFYMAGFFVGFEMGPCIPGVIPLDVQAGSFTSQHSSSGHGVLAGDMGKSAAVFGAPVANLSGKSVKALPIDLGKVMGETEAVKFLASVRERNDESYPPRACKATIKKIMTRWMDVHPLAKISESGYSEDNWISSVAEGFEDADLGRAVLEYKTRLARKFNSLQAEDPLNDGIIMTVHGHMLSAVCQFHTPLPKTDGVWHLSCARNMRLAVSALPFKTGTFTVGSHVRGHRVGAGILM